MTAYDAFISYSHAKDKLIATALQSAIQRLGKPWYRRRGLRVFRDDTSLSATPRLWPSIERALETSRYFILLASPEAASSPWVDKEVSYWLTYKGVGTFLIALTDGALAWDDTGCNFSWDAGVPLPPAINGRLPAEPRWIDLTAFRDHPDWHDPRFIELAANFAAAIREVPKEDLLSQEVREQRRALTLASSAAGALAVAVSIAGWQWHTAIKQRDRAEGALAAATEAANKLVFEVAIKFRRRVGIPTDLIHEILAKHVICSGSWRRSAAHPQKCDA